MAKKPKKNEAGLIDVVAKIDAGENPPDDLMVAFQIDSRRLTMVKLIGKAKLSTGVHTASWSVVSLTKKPLKFAVTITAPGSAAATDDRTLLSRPNETTGADGLGLGADLFSA